MTIALKDCKPASTLQGRRSSQKVQTLFKRQRHKTLKLSRELSKQKKTLFQVRNVLKKRLKINLSTLKQT
jgi:hypothetical protein